MTRSSDRSTLKRDTGQWVNRARGSRLGGWLEILFAVSFSPTEDSASACNGASTDKQEARMCKAQRFFLKALGGAWAAQSVQSGQSQGSATWDKGTDGRTREPRKPPKFQIHSKYPDSPAISSDLSYMAPSSNVREAPTLTAHQVGTNTERSL